MFHGVYRGVGVAVKILTTAADVDSFSNFRHEVSIMAKLKHNNLVALRGISMKDPPAIALEYVEFGALHVLLGENHNLDLNLKVRFAFDIGMTLLSMVIPIDSVLSFSSAWIIIHARYAAAASALRSEVAQHPHCESRHDVRLLRQDLRLWHVQTAVH